MSSVISPTIITNDSEQASGLMKALFETAGTKPYEAVLQDVQSYISKKLAEKGGIDGQTEESLKFEILKYITDFQVKCSLTDKPAQLANHLYHDMAGFSFITREGLLTMEGFEELDVNRWDDIDIILNGRREKTAYRFLSPQHAVDIHKRMLQQKEGTILDKQMPYVVADLGANTRIAALLSPIVDEEAGVACSIRKVSSTTIRKEMLVGTALTGDMLELLTLAVRCRVSTCFSGETGSGKTTLAGYILRDAARYLDMVTIEEGSREWDFLHRDADGNITNRVVHMKTRPSDQAETNISQNKLLQICLRFNPTVIGVGEMRSDEAYAATEASMTGHTVVTTVHANSAAEAPKRIVGLCKKAYDFSDSTLMGMVADAWPLHVYLEFLPDRSRRVTEIVEVMGYKDGVLQYQPLFEYQVEDNITSADGSVQVLGRFVQVNPISDRLYKRMLKKGASRSQLERFRKGGKCDD